MQKRPFAAFLILLLSLSILTMLAVRVAEAAPYVTLSDVELGTQFSKAYGPSGSTVIITDKLGTGVEFNFTNLDTSQATGASDNYDVSPLAGGDLDALNYYGNFSRYTHYRLEFKNQGATAVDVNLFMNTGYTGPPFNDPTRDTFWKCSSVTVGVGETKAVTLDFSAAICWNAGDDPNPSWKYGNGETHPVHRLDEVTNIGFEVLGSDGGSLLVDGYASGTTRLYVDPTPVQKQNTDVNTVFEVAVKVEEITDLYGFDLKLSWDDTLLSLDHVDYENTPTSPLKFIWGPTKNTDYGVQTAQAGSNYYRLVAFSLKNGFTGSHALLILGFKVLNPQTNSKKTCQLHFEASYDKLSDSNAQSIVHTTTDGTYEIWGGAPTLDMTHANVHSRKCRKIDEEFTLTVSISDAVNLAGLDFEISYDTSMINYSSSLLIWGSGTINHDETGGTVTGSVTGGGGGSGAFALLNITFKSDSNFKRFWKDPSTGQSSNLFPSSTGIYFQSITLHYASLPDIVYTRGGGGGGRIYVGPDFAYTYAPIRGDLNNDGKVDISDLSWEASFFDTTNSTMNLVGTDTIDIFDLVVIAGNFWYEYTPPAP
jgi:hypothetical protein